MAWEKLSQQQPDMWRQYGYLMGDPQSAPMTRIEPIGPGMEFDRRTPRVPTIHSDTGVPLTQSIVAAVFAGLSAATIAAACNAPIKVTLGSGMVVFSIVGLIVYILLLIANRDTLYRLENATRMDINGDGVVGQPVEAQPAQSVKVDILLKSQEGKQMHNFTFDLPCNSETLRLVARATLKGDLLRDEDWSGRKAGKPFSEERLSEFRTAFVRHGLAEWKDANNHKLGLAGLTELGRQWATELTTPLPQDQTR
jgi:hypothetical protein